MGSTFSVFAQEVEEKPTQVLVHAMRKKVAHAQPGRGEGSSIQVQAWSKLKQKMGPAQLRQARYVWKVEPRTRIRLVLG